MKRKTASIILILAVLAFTIPHIFAASNYIEGTVRSIETNDSVENIKIDIVNCTNWSQIFNTTITGENGTFRMEYNNTWGCYLINTSGNANYIAKQFSNNSQCFENGTDQTLNIYRTDTSSLNITLKDKANSRPIPDAIIKLYPSNIPSNQIDQSKNYRCQNNICKTDANGNILLIVPNPGTYKLTIESDEYDNWNETLPKFNSYNELGKNRDYIKTLNGSGIIAGKVIDFYNSKNIEGAFVELYRHDSDPNSGENLSFSGIYNYSTLTDENGEYEIHIPPSLISSTHYDIRASHKDWTSKINYNNNLDETSGGWNSLNTNIIVRINGTLLLNGSFHDCNNIDTQLSLDIYITDKSAAGFNYHTHTDNGNFSIFIKNTTTGYDGYNITINGTQYNAETLANAQQTITHCINGSRTINGTIRDIQNNWPIENATIGITLDDGNWYETKTASGGVFEINVKNGIPYSIDIQKTGYSARMSLTDDDGIYGTINLTGATHIYGYVEDKEGEKRTAGPRIKNVTAKILNTTTLAEIYSTKTDSNGYYSLYLPSNINYTAKFEKNQYNPQESNYTEGRAPDTTTYLTGNTHIDGHILDASAFAVNKNITAGANLEFKDSESTKYILTPATGQYSIDMAIGNYNITASKQGYDTKTETGDTSGSSISKHINLKGSLNMTIYTTDDFSSQPVDLINMRLFDKSTGNLNYDNIVSLHGIINISVDSGRQYYIAVYENKYLPVYEEITPIGTVFEKEYRLKAKYETRVTDSQNGWPVENAAVQAYHYFNQTDYTYNINETILNVTVNCSGILLNDINVTITGGTHYDSKNTTSGIATFNRMPINNYTVEANGSLKGCSTGNITINIDEGGASYNTTIHLNATTFMVRVLNSICETIYPANVSYENSSGSQIVMLSFNNTYYYENHIATGNYNVSANESNHYNNTVLCNVTAPGETNYCNITLQPKPGNLSIYVYDSSLNPITGARVSITNTTASYEIATVGGWANFTDIKSSWNMTINATGVGYIFIGENNIYAYPNNETLLQRLLEDTNISVTVSDDLGLLENANVSLTDKTTGNIMQNYLGAYMTSLTDKNGTVHFTRFNRTEYNITINETSHEFYNQTYILSLEISNNFTINLDTTRVIVNVKDTYSNPIENICITLNKTDSSANFTDNTNSTGNIIFESQTFPPGQYNLTVDGTQDGYNHTTKLIDIYAGSQTTENIVLEEYRLTVQVNGSYNNHSIENATVAINTTPVSVKNTDSQGKAYFLKLEKEIYNVTINGTSIGYNYTNTITTVTGDTQTSITLKENTFIIEVFDEEGNPVGGGVDVILWDPYYNTNIYDDALGNNLINITTDTDNNATFRKMQYETSPGNTITMVANGSNVGYGINQTNYTILPGANGPNTTTLNITQILVNVTNSTGAPVNAANVSILTESGDPVQNALGATLNGTTASNGTITFKRVLPGTYNISISKDIESTIIYNSTLATISAGEHKYIHLDPNNTLIPSLKGSYYKNIFESVSYDLTINISGILGPVKDVLVKVYASGYNYSDSYWYNYEATDNKTTDANGIVMISGMSSGVYDILIDGESQGYGITKTQIMFGKLMFSNGTTGSDGIINMPVDGRVIENAVDNGYFIRITAAGYGTHDTLDKGESACIGTYYDHSEYDQNIYPGYSTNNRTEISLTGIINITGTIIDKFAENAQDAFRYMSGAFIELIIQGTETARYTTDTDSDGNYSINISPVLPAAEDLESPVTYNIKYSKTGYITGIEEKTMPKQPAVLTADKGLEGTHVVNGTVYTYNGEVIENITVIYKDNRTNSEIYRTTTDLEGKYELIVNPYYQPYSLSFLDNTSNTKDYTTQSYTEPHTDEIYYLLKQNQAIINLYILDDFNKEIEGAEVTFKSTINGNSTVQLTNENGKIDFFIDGHDWNTGEYNMTVNGKALGYGLKTETEIIGAGYNTITVVINTTKINITVQNNHGGEVYNITATLTGPLSNITAVENNTALFTKTISGQYNITFESLYFKGNTINLEINDSNAGTEIPVNCILNESMIPINIINETGHSLENISISVCGPTAYNGKTDSNGWLNKTVILPGNYTIYFTNITEFTEKNYFVPDNMTFIQTPGNTTQIKITAKERIINIYVKAYHLEDIYNLSRTEITDDSLNISLTNETGITFNRTGNLNSIITTDGIANFTGIHDGTYRINVTGTNYTFDNLTTFNTTAQGFCNEPKIFLKKNQAGYINITIISGSIPLTDATVKLFWNSTTQLSSKTTGNSGRAIFSVNPTIHNSTLYIQASKAGYVTKDTAVFNLTAGEVNSIILSLAVQSTGQTGSSGSSRSRPSIISSPNITENETAAQKNVSDQTEREEYKYTETSTEIENSIEQNQDLNNLLEQHFGELSEKDMQEIAQETKNINKYITLTRDIHTDKNGKTVIGLNIYYKKDEPEIVYDFVLYDTLPKELITIDKITFTETAAKIIKDEDSNSYLAIIPKIEKDTYCRIEFTTEEYIDPSKIDALSRPIILSAATKSAETENKTQIQEPEQQETKDKKSILGYWWILALAAFAVSTGIIIINIIKKRKQAKVYSFKPIETKKPLNPPYIPTTNITDAKNIADAPNGFKKAQKIQNIEKKVEKIEKEIAKNIKETAQKNAVYLTKPLEKEKFIVD